MRRDLEGGWSTFKMSLMSYNSRLPVSFTIRSAANTNALLHANLLSLNKLKRSKFDLSALLNPSSAVGGSIHLEIAIITQLSAL